MHDIARGYVYVLLHCYWLNCLSFSFIDSFYQPRGRNATVLADLCQHYLFICEGNLTTLDCPDPEVWCVVCVCVCVCVCVWCLLDTVSRIVLLALNMAKVFYCRIYPPHGTCRRWGFYEAQTPDLTNQIARFRYVHVVQFTTVLWIALFHWIIVCLDMLSSLQCGDIINIMWQYPCDDIINIMWQYHP